MSWFLNVVLPVANATVRRPVTAVPLLAVELLIFVFVFCVADAQHGSLAVENTSQVLWERSFFFHPTTHHSLFWQSCKHTNTADLLTATCHCISDILFGLIQIIRFLVSQDRLGASPGSEHGISQTQGRNHTSWASNDRPNIKTHQTNKHNKKLELNGVSLLLF